MLYTEYPSLPRHLCVRDVRMETYFEELGAAWRCLPVLTVSRPRLALAYLLRLIFNFFDFFGLLAFFEIWLLWLLCHLWLLCLLGLLWILCLLCLPWLLWCWALRDFIWRTISYIYACCMSAPLSSNATAVEAKRYIILMNSRFVEPRFFLDLLLLIVLIVLIELHLEDQGAWCPTQSRAYWSPRAAHGAYPYASDQTILGSNDTGSR